MNDLKRREIEWAEESTTIPQSYPLWAIVQVAFDNCEEHPSAGAFKAWLLTNTAGCSPDPVIAWQFRPSRSPRPILGINGACDYDDIAILEPSANDAITAAVARYLELKEGDDWPEVRQPGPVISPAGTAAR